MRQSFEELFERAFERYPDISGVVATSARQERDLWQLREDTDAIYRRFPAAPSYDVSVPVSAIERYLARALHKLRVVDAALHPFVFGHLADGNLHIVLNHAGPMPLEKSRAVEAAVYEDLAGLGGAFSAEHGIGSKRMHALAAYSDKTKRELMRLVKGVVDAPGVLNRGKLIIP